MKSILSTILGLSLISGLALAGEGLNKKKGNKNKKKPAAAATAEMNAPASQTDNQSGSPSEAPKH